MPYTRTSEPSNKCSLIYYFVILAYIIKIFSQDMNLIGNFPKIELHSHLHGSIRHSTLEELITKNSVSKLGGASKSDDIISLNEFQLSIHDPFTIFSAIHQTVRTKVVIERILEELIQDLISDNVIYAEIRTTPRALDDLNEEEYLKLVLNIMNLHNTKSIHKHLLQLRLIISINRKMTLEVANKVIDMAIGARNQYSSNLVVGIDFSGDFTIGSFNDFIIPFTRAKNEGFAITLHAGEEERLKDQEMKSILFFLLSKEEEEDVKVNVDVVDVVDAVDAQKNKNKKIIFKRIGHALFINDEEMSLLLEHYQQFGERDSILIEIPPTSNMWTLNLNHLEEHPTLNRWLQNDYPISISVDDSGVFNTTLSYELQLVQNTFNLSTSYMASLMMRPVHHVFDQSTRNMRYLEQKYRDYVYSLPLNIRDKVLHAVEDKFSRNIKVLNKN